MKEQIVMINQGNPDLGDEFVTLNIETVCSVTSEAWGTLVNVTKYPVGRRKTYLQTKLKPSMDQVDKSADSDGEEDGLDTLMHQLEENVVGSKSTKQIPLLILVLDKWSILIHQIMTSTHHLDIFIQHGPFLCHYIAF